eukprot:5081412-Alexandrium_andersonii.AAC.1
MSASLVGSEMCIRDRNKNEMARHSGYSPSMWVLGSAGPHLPGGLLDADAVSYTHLTLPTICSV